MSVIVIHGFRVERRHPYPVFLLERDDLLEFAHLPFHRIDTFHYDHDLIPLTMLAGLTFDDCSADDTLQIHRI